jgi:hypothetical protein
MVLVGFRQNSLIPGAGGLTRFGPGPKTMICLMFQVLGICECQYWMHICGRVSPNPSPVTNQGCGNLLLHLEHAKSHGMSHVVSHGCTGTIFSFSLFHMQCVKSYTSLLWFSKRMSKSQYVQNLCLGIQTASNTTHLTSFPSHYLTS